MEFDRNRIVQLLPCSNVSRVYSDGMENVLGFVTVMEQCGSKLGLMNMKLGFIYIKMGKKTLKYVFPI